MKLKNVLLAMGATVTLAAPIAAQAGTASAASVGKLSTLSGVGKRSSVSIQKKKKDEADGISTSGAGGGGGYVVGGLALAAGIGGIIAATNNNNSTPVSPST